MNPVDQEGAGASASTSHLIMEADRAGRGRVVKPLGALGPASLGSDPIRDITDCTWLGDLTSLSVSSSTK